MRRDLHHVREQERAVAAGQCTATVDGAIAVDVKPANTSERCVRVNGAGVFPGTSGYGFPFPDEAPLPVGYATADDGWTAAEVTVSGDAGLPALWRACVARWADAVRAATGGA